MTVARRWALWCQAQVQCSLLSHVRRFYCGHHFCNESFTTRCWNRVLIYNNFWDKRTVLNLPPCWWKSFLGGNSTYMFLINSLNSFDCTKIQISNFLLNISFDADGRTSFFEYWCVSNFFIQKSLYEFDNVHCFAVEAKLVVGLKTKEYRLYSVMIWKDTFYRKGLAQASLKESLKNRITLKYLSVFNSKKNDSEQACVLAL